MFWRKGEDQMICISHLLPDEEMKEFTKNMEQELKALIFPFLIIWIIFRKLRKITERKWRLWGQIR